MRIEAFETGLSPETLAQLMRQLNKQEGTSGVDSLTGAPLSQAGGVQGVGGATANTRKPPVGLNPEITLELYEIIKLLDIGQNKLTILRLLRRSDWIKLLYLLPKELLINGLRLFSKEKLLRLIMSLPKEFLIKMMLFLFTIDELIAKMPTSELMRILRSPKLNNRALVRGLQQMNMEFIYLLLYRIYGDSNYAAMKPCDLWQLFMHTNKSRMMEAFKTLSFKALTPFATRFVKEDPELLMLISDEFIFKIFDRMTKPTLMTACIILPEDLLIKMLTQLPDNFLVQVAAQIDDKAFIEYLIFSQPQFLQSLAA